MNRHIDGRCGKTFDDTLQLFHDYNQIEPMPFLMIATWNDYEEGTAIEAGASHKCAAATNGSGMDREMDLDMTPMTMDEVVQTAGSSRSRYLDLLSQLLLGDSAELKTSATNLELRILADWDDEEFTRFFAFADLHHVLVRGIEALQSSTAVPMSPRSADRCTAALARSRSGSVER